MKLPLDLLLLVDASQSMDELSGTQSKWDRMRAALGAFVNDPASAGLGVGLSFFPSQQPTDQRACAQDADCAGFSPTGTVRPCTRMGACYAPGLPIADRRCAPGLVSPFNCPAGLTCLTRGRCTQSGELCVSGSPCPGGAGDTCALQPGSCRVVDEGCNFSQYGKLDVGIAELPAVGAQVVAALSARLPSGLTPMAVVVASATGVLQKRLQSQPQRRAALVLATDGLPTGCAGGESVDRVTARITEARAGAPTLPTYVVGVFAPDEIAMAQPALQRFAAAGGTGMPFVLATGEDLTQRLLEALKEIRGLAVACDYAIPAPQQGEIDFGKVNVRTTAGGRSEELGAVTGAERCGDRGGWYYDPAPAPGKPPGRIVICPQSCQALRGDAGARVDLIFGCATRIIE